MGCSTPSSSHYPIGIYGVPESAMAEVKEAGFNTVKGPANHTYLDAAHRNGLRVLASASVARAMTNGAAMDRIRELDRHPALWGWYLFDEPDLHRVPPTRIARMNRALERAANKPSVLVLMSGSSVAHYGDYCDLVGLDFYPVPWAPLSQFGKEMKLARIGLGEKPYFAILQAFDWTAYSELLDTEEPLRPPTFDELRCMVFMALAQQTKGLFFYTYHAGEWTLPENDLWNDVKALVQEVNNYLPLFTAKHLWWSPAMEYLEGTDAMHNEVRDGKVMLSLLEVKQGNDSVPAGRYALAINTTADSVPFRLQLPTDGPTVPILGLDHQIPLSNSTLTTIFAPYEVIVYGPFF